MKRLSLQQNERGLVSFMVIIIMMLVISLIVLGFSQVTQRNSRETLDRELSDQATYAAESGINVAAAAIKAGNVQQQSQCDGTAYPPASLTSDNGVAYTCVLVDPYPKSLEFDGSVNTETPTIARLESSDNTFKFAQLTFSWTKQANSGTSTQCNGPGVANNNYIYPPNDTTNWTCDMPVLRVDLVQDVDNLLKGGGTVAKLDNNTTTIFMSPLGAGIGNKAISFGSGAGGSGTRVFQESGHCDANFSSCTATVTFSPAANNYYVRMTSLYRNPASVTISGQAQNGTPAQFANSQATIDVTGRAQDQLKRIQVRLPLSDTLASEQIPINALGSKVGICKRFVTLPGDNPSSINDCSAP